MKGKAEITITSKNQVSLPAASLKELGWQCGAGLVRQFRWIYLSDYL